MKEIEIKVLEIDKQKMIEKLIGLGAKKVAEDKQLSIFYDFPDKRLKKEKGMLRLREFNGKTFITLKKHISEEGAKESEEFETDISDIKEMENIIVGLGLKKFDCVNGKRTRYKIDKTNFEFDGYDGIPCYMEIEAPCRKIIDEWVEKLGIDNSKIRAWHGRDLFTHYGIKVY